MKVVKNECCGFGGPGGRGKGEGSGPWFLAGVPKDGTTFIRQKSHFTCHCDNVS